MTATYPMFVKRDIDGFFGLFIDNLVQFLVILMICATACGMQGDDALFLFRYIFPGAAVSILIGNLFYAWQAHRLAAREGRSDITALPYGINTPSMFVFIFFVMEPVYRQTGSAEQAWKMGLIACLGSGLIELCGAFFAERIRKHTPRAALLATLAGIAIGFISMTFTLQIFHKPLIAMVPLGLILLALFSHTRFPLGMPGGMVAVACGTGVAWLITWLAPLWPQAPEWLTVNTLEKEAVARQFQTVGLYVPQFVGGMVWELLLNWREWVGFLSVIIPMGLFNIIGSLQNIESAEAGGDRFDTTSSLAVNGLGTIGAALFGSCFPTTIYIGHPGWKAMGARAGYSSLNGVVVTILCCTGLIGLASSVIPVEAAVPIVLWIGIIITAQAFQATPHDHAPAVAIGLFPAIAAWGSTVMIGTFFAAGGSTVQELLVANPNTEVNGFLVAGLITLERGYIFTCMILSAMTACLIDRRFYAAAVWCLLAALGTFTGLMHAFQLQGNVIDYYLLLESVPETAYRYPAIGIGLGYLGMAVVCLIARHWGQGYDHLTPSSPPQEKPAQEP